MTEDRNLRLPFNIETHQTPSKSQIELIISQYGYGKGSAFYSTPDFWDAGNPDEFLGVRLYKKQTAFHVTTEKIIVYSNTSSPPHFFCTPFFGTGFQFKTFKKAIVLRAVAGIPI